MVFCLFVCFNFFFCVVLLGLFCFGYFVVVSLCWGGFFCFLGFFPSVQP